MDVMGILITQTLSGLSAGTIYGMMAVGLSIIFGLLGVVNFAHYAFYAAGAYLALLIMQVFGLSFWSALIAATVITGGIGACIERTLIRRLYGWDPSTTLIFTFGLACVMIEIIKLTQGVGFKSMPVPAVLSGSIKYFNFQFSHYRLFFILFGAVIFFLVYLLLTKTSLGLQIQSATQDRNMARVLGIKTSRVFTFTFALGVSLAGLGAIISCPITGIYPDMGAELLVIAFAVVIIGGMGSFFGTIVASYSCGMLSSFATLISPQMSTIAIFVFMAIVILVRPGGLFGKAISSER